MEPCLSHLSSGQCGPDNRNVVDQWEAHHRLLKCSRLAKKKPFRAEPGRESQMVSEFFRKHITDFIISGGKKSTYRENLKDIDTCESQFFMSAVHWKRHRNVAEVLGEQGDQCSGPSGHGKGKIQLIHIINPNSTQEKILKSFN